MNEPSSNIFKVISKHMTYLLDKLILLLFDLRLIRNADYEKLFYAAKCNQKIKKNINFNSDHYANLKTLIKTKDPLIVDVGAHHGKVALKYLESFNDCSLYAFEPTPSSYKILQKNLKPFKKAKIYNTAISDCDGPVDFFLNTFSPTNSLLCFSEQGASGWGDELLVNEKKIRVECKKLDTFASFNKIETIDVLKIDVQGAEKKVLRGAENLLKKNMIKHIYTEVIFENTYKNQVKFYELYSYLKDFGYDIYNIYNPVEESGKLLQFDILFKIER